MFHFSRKFAAPLAVLLVSAASSLTAQSTTAGAVTATVTSSANPSVFASPVTFTIVVAAPTAAGPAPTGSVTATLGSVFLGEGSLDSTGKAAITVPPQPSPLATPPWGLPAGSNAITFSYSGDTKYKAAQSTYTQFVNKANTTTTAAVSGNAQPLRLSATVHIDEPSVSTTPYAGPGNLGTSDPTGSVQFFDGTTLLGTATLAPSGLFASTAALTVATVPASLTAVYAGDDNYNGSTAPVVAGTPKSSVGLTVTSSVNPSIFAEPVTFTITVAPATAGGSVPSGTVGASLLGLLNLGSVTLDSSGKGSLTVPVTAATAIPWGLPAGSDSITFSYSGDAHYSATQSTFTQTVDKAATATRATVSPSLTGITATVTISEPSAGSLGFALPGAVTGSSPTGIVQFLNGSTAIGTAPLMPNGHFQSAATLTVSQPFSASADLTAVYNGDANYTGSTSPRATIPTLGAVTIGVASSVNPSTFAEPVTFTVKVAPAASGNVIPTGMVQASVLGSDVLGAGTLDSTGSASITVPSQLLLPTPAVLLWGLATGSNIITVSYSGDSNFAAGQANFNQLVNQANTSTNLIPAPEPIGSNSLTVLARVSIDEASVSKTDFRIPAPGNLSTSPTGNVDFFDGATLLGTVKLTPGSQFQSSATFTATPPPTSIRAVYYGDINYTGSSSPSTSPGNGAVTITLASSANPTTYGAAFTVLATVAPATAGGPMPTGSLQFFDGSQNLNWTATLDSSGHGTLSIPIPLATPLFCAITCPPAANVLVLGAGSHSITAQYSGDVNYAPAKSTNPLTEQITKAPSTTALSAFSTFAGALSASGLVATVADAQPPSGGPYHFMVLSASGATDGNPTGTMTFYSGTMFIGTGKLAPNISGNVTSTASLNSSAMNSTGPFTATYPGDANFQGSSSPTPAPTKVTLTGTPNPSNTGQSVTLTAAIATASATPAPTGHVDFLDGTKSLGSAPVSGTTATLTTTFTTAGAHSLTANYSGDANYSPTLSAVYTQTVNASTTPMDTLKLTVSTSTAVFGQHIVLFAQVVGNVSASPTGTVNFLDGTTTIGSGKLSESSAYAVVTLAVGIHKISATWAGDSNWPAAQSAVVTVTVDQAKTVTALTHFGTAWTAQVMALPPGEGVPTGTVKFIDSVTQAVLATGTLNEGVATVTLDSVTDRVQAVYSGDTNFEPSTSGDASTRPRSKR